jgi:hypothetical protein
VSSHQNTQLDLVMAITGSPPPLLGFVARWGGDCIGGGGVVFWENFQEMCSSRSNSQQDTKKRIQSRIFDQELPFNFLFFMLNF